MENTTCKIKPISEVAKEARLRTLKATLSENPESVSEDECEFLEGDSVPVKVRDALSRLIKYGTAVDFWRLNMKEIERLLLICNEKKLKVESRDVFVKLLTMGDWPNSPLKTINVVGFMMSLRPYFEDTCGVTRAELNKIVVDNLRLGITDSPRNARAVAAAMLILATLFDTHAESAAAFGDLTNMLQFENVLTIDMHMVALEEDFKKLCACRDQDLKCLTADRMCALLKTVETKLTKINTLLDKRNRDVIRFNIADMIYQCAVDLKDATINSYGAKDQVLGALTGNHLRKVTVEDIANMLGEWEILVLDGAEARGCLLDLGGSFFQLAVSDAGDQVRLEISEFVDMATLHPKEFLSWIDGWLSFNIDNLPSLTLIED